MSLRMVWLAIKVFCTLMSCHDHQCCHIPQRSGMSVIPIFMINLGVLFLRINVLNVQSCGASGPSSFEEPRTVVSYQESQLTSACSRNIGHLSTPVCVCASLAPSGALNSPHSSFHTRLRVNKTPADQTAAQVTRMHTPLAQAHAPPANRLTRRPPITFT